MSRFLTRLMSMNDRWAAPFGEVAHRWSHALFSRIGPVRDLLSGTWLGHPLHGASTDLPIGLLVGAVVLDLLGQPAAADITFVLVLVTMVVSALSGLADYADTDGRARTRATLHGTIMVVSLLAIAASVLLRAGAPADRTPSTVVGIAGLVLMLAGAFVGGDVVYVLGNMVNRHAFRGVGTKWIRLDTGDVADLADLPDGVPTRMRAGANDLVVVRRGAAFHAMHAVCAHAGGPLAEGTVTPDGCLVCPWHGATYRLADGTLRRGPSVYDQPAYDVRAAEAGGYEVRRRATS
jgi:nitrite reductase/ring-hydroxylating ferredoxin subunit/uncharacterized membrane protein